MKPGLALGLAVAAGIFAAALTGCSHPAASSVAVDAQGNVYAIDFESNQVLKLAAGATSPIALPFSGLNQPGTSG